MVAASSRTVGSAVQHIEGMLRRTLDFSEAVMFLKDPGKSRVLCYSGNSCLGTMANLPRDEAFFELTIPSSIDHPVSLASSPHEHQLPVSDTPVSHMEFYPDAGNMRSAQCFYAGSDEFGILLKGSTALTVEDRALLRSFASALGPAVQNVILRERNETLQRSVDNAFSHLDFLRAFAQVSLSAVEHQSLIDGLCNQVSRKFGTEILCLVTYRPDQDDLHWAALHLPDGRGPKHIGKVTSLNAPSGANISIRTRKPFLADRNCIEQTATTNCIGVLLSQEAKTYYSMPLGYGGKIVGVMVAAHVNTDHFTHEEIRLWEDCAKQISPAVECLQLKQESERLRSQVCSERVSPPYEVSCRHEFSGLVGESAALKRVFSQVEVVAHTDSSVLIMGETGTGKGMLALALHRLSDRKDRPFVQVNCATIPAPLLESEMFGHEKGAFTGATSKRVGCFERASGGTLFLDEIGEMPLELQPKLLRAVQEQRFERLGGSSSIQADIRFIWATNRDLKRMVAEKQFRGDLYYRLDVFPIVVPPLRERIEDIPLLVHCFVREFCMKMGKTIDRVPAATMDQLMRRQWPGNVRELRNVVERAAILSPGRVLELPQEDLTDGPTEFFDPPNSQVGRHSLPSGLQEFEREYILQVLRETGGVVAWAASRLQVKRTTLDSRLRRLGISEKELQIIRKSGTGLRALPPLESGY